MADEIHQGNNNDPDHIDAHPPSQVHDPKEHFQTGRNEGKWLEYDERGVPTKTIRKKKLTKKEKDALEAEYLEAKKKHQQYLRDIEAWGQRRVDAENALERSDPLRWAFRQIGEKNGPIKLDELEDFFHIMGWNQLKKREVAMLKKAAMDFAEEDRTLTLEALRIFTKEHMAMHILEERLSKGFDAVTLEALYSPRSWRRRVETVEHAVSTNPKQKKENKSKKDVTDSPARQETRTPRRSSKPVKVEKVKKRRSDEEERLSTKSPRSTRGSSSPRSPRGRL